MSAARRSLRRHLVAGIVLAFGVVVGGGVWALSTELAGAIIAEGQLVVESSKKTIQSPNNGVVAEIRVDDGDSVKAGDLLVRLDDTQARADLEIVQKQIDELEARQARVEAELAGADAVEFPESLLMRSSQDSAAARILAGELALFRARLAAREGQKDQYRQQIDQLNEQISGLLAQQVGKQQEIDLNAKELERLQQLWEQHLTVYSNVTQAAKDAAKLSADFGELKATIAAARGRIAEIELKVIQVDQDERSQNGKELADLRSALAQLREKRVAAMEQLNRVEIRAPQDGTVHELAFHTVRGVVAAGQPIMTLIPNTDTLTVEAKVRPQDIDQLSLGQQAMVRFIGLNLRSTPEIAGSVTRISPDVVQDGRTGASYYVVRIGLAPDEIAKLDGVKLVPGMPVEAFVTTAARTAISYLARPFFDQVSHAFRER